jgi:hypothetical protein
VAIEIAYSMARREIAIHNFFIRNYRGSFPNVPNKGARAGWIPDDPQV